MLPSYQSSRGLIALRMLDQPAPDGEARPIVAGQAQFRILGHNAEPLLSADLHRGIVAPVIGASDVQFVSRGVMLSTQAVRCMRFCERDAVKRRVHARCDARAHSTER